MITYKINGRRIEAWDINPQTGAATLVAVGGDRTGVPENVPVLEQDDPGVASLVAAIGSGMATPDQIGQLSTHLGALNRDSAVNAVAPQQPATQPSGQTATVREQVPDITESTYLAAAERGYQADVNALQQGEHTLNQRYQNTPGFGPAPWAPIMQWNPGGQQTDGAGNPIGAAVEAGKATFPENIRMPSEYGAAYRARGAEAAAADLQARKQELQRRENEFAGRDVGRQKLEAIGQNRRAAERGRQQLATSEAWAASKSANDRGLVPSGASGWVHGENAGAANAIAGLDDQFDQMQWSWFPEQQVAAIQEDVRTGKRARDYRTMNVLPPGYQHGGQVQTQARMDGRSVVADVLPPGIPRFELGGSSGYGQGSGGYAQAWSPPQGEGWGDPTHASLTKRTQQAGDIRFQSGLDQTAQTAALARIEQQKQFQIGQLQAQHATRIADLQARTQQALAEVAQEAGGVATAGAATRAQVGLGQFVPRGQGTFAG